MKHIPDHCAHVAAYYAHSVDAIAGCFASDLLATDRNPLVCGPGYAVKWVRMQYVNARFAVQYFNRSNAK